MRTVIGRTVINIRGARGTSPAWRTLTLKPQGGLLAAASVVAGVREAGVFRNFTVGSRIALRAGTLVFVRTRVATGPPVETRLMGPTVIEICQKDAKVTTRHLSRRLTLHGSIADRKSVV